MNRILGNQQRTFSLLLFFVSASGFAEYIPAPGSNYQVGQIYQNGTATNAQLNQQNEQGEDRREKHNETIKQIQDTNNQKLQPNMQMHNGNAAKHFKEAQQARQNKEEGRAKEEEQKGMMELMKAQQLNQQIQANNKTADQNAQNAQTLKNQEAIKVPNVPKGADLANALLNAAAARRSERTAEPEESRSPVPSTELVNLSSVEIPKPTQARADQPPPLEPDKRSSFGYDERGVTATATSSGSIASSGASPPASTAATTASTASPAPATGAAALGGGVVAKSGGGAGGDFFASVGNMVDQENRQITAANEKFSLKGLRGKNGKKDEKVPGAGLSDEEFWKKVGKEPAKCKAATALTKRQRQQCLKVARKDFEKRWREAQKKRPAIVESEPDKVEPASAPPANEPTKTDAPPLKTAAK